LRQVTKSHKNRSNRRGDIAIFVIFNMVAAAVMDFQKLTILTLVPLKGADMRHRAKCHQNRSNGCTDTAI